MNEWFERVARQAVELKPTKVLLTLLALPFYLVGVVLGFVLVAALFAFSAVKVGVGDVRGKATARAEGT